MTPKASPLNNRGYYSIAEAPPASCYAVTSTLKGCPTLACYLHYSLPLTLYPLLFTLYPFL